jgi:hypothetical protein
MPARNAAGSGTVKCYPVRPQPIAMWLHIGLSNSAMPMVVMTLAATASTATTRPRTSVAMPHLRPG